MSSLIIQKTKPPSSNCFTLRWRYYTPMCMSEIRWPDSSQTLFRFQLSALIQPLSFTTIFNTLSNVFGHTAAAQVHVPAFETLWGFTLASDSPVLQLPEESIDGLLSTCVNKDLKHYDAETHRGMFALPKHLRNGFKSETRINRDATPVFMA